MVISPYSALTIAKFASYIGGILESGKNKEMSFIKLLTYMLFAFEEENKNWDRSHHQYSDSSLLVALIACSNDEETMLCALKALELFEKNGLIYKEGELLVLNEAENKEYKSPWAPNTRFQHLVQKTEEYSEQSFLSLYIQARRIPKQ